MNQIESGLKTFEFRKYRISETVKRVWFYVTARESRISHICEVGAATTGTTADQPLPLTGLGNKEFNEHHMDWDGYDYAYEIKDVYLLEVPLELKIMKEKYGWKGAPRGLMFVASDLDRFVSSVLDLGLEIGREFFEQISDWRVLFSGPL